MLNSAAVHEELSAQREAAEARYLKRIRSGESTIEIYRLP